MRANWTMFRKNIRWSSSLSITLAAMGVAALLFCFYREENQHIRIRSRSEFQIGNEGEIEYNIEDENFGSAEDGRIHGWFVRKGQTYDYFNAGMMEAGSGVYNNNHLCYVKDNVVYELPTKLEYREDISDMLDDGVNYAYCGFYARIYGITQAELEDAQLGMIAETPDGEEILYFLR